MKHKFLFECIDNGGKRQCFTVTAKDKASAIEKGFKKAKKNARGDINNWNCKLINCF